jgi:CHAT domain-containing protein/tetratricopeptide (TPR) repeat protein
VRIAPRTRGCSLIGIALVVQLLASCAASVVHAAPAADSSFWARYTRLVDVLDSDTSAARTEVRAMLARDPDDALARWARGARLTPADSASRAALSAAADADSAAPGPRFEHAIASSGRARAAAWREFDRARSLYVRAGRPAEAARAEVLMLSRDADLRAIETRARRFADAESLALADGDTLTAATAAMRAAAELSNRAGAEALPALERLTNQLRRRPASAVASDAFAWRASTLKNLGRLDEAEPLYREATRLAREAGVPSLGWRAAMGLAGARRARGDVREAMEEERRLLAEVRAAGNSLFEGLLLASLGSSELALHHLDEARTALTGALAVLDRRGGNFDTRVSVLDQLGGVDALAGRPDSAARRFEEALALARSRGYRNREAFVLLHLAQFALERGRPEEAKQWNDAALEAARASGRQRAEELGYSQGAVILTELGRASEAADLAIRGAAMTRTGEARNYGVAVALAVHVLTKAGRYAEAAALVDSLQGHLAAHPDSFTSATAGRLRARLHLADGNAVAAVAALERSIAILRALDARDEWAAQQLDLGTALLEAERPAEAAAAFERGLSWFEDVLAESRSTDDRISAQSRWQDSYVDLAVARLRAGNAGDAFAVMDRCRARELRRAFGERAPVAPGAIPVPLARELGGVRDAIAEAQARLVSQYALPPAGRNRLLASWEAQADSLRGRLLDLRRRAERAAPAAAVAGGYAEALPPDSLRARLHPGERLLAFFVGERHVLRFEATRDSLAVRELPWSGSALRSTASAWREKLSAGAGNEWREGAARLADTLLAGLDVAGTRRWYVIPDGALHALPFEALLVRGAHGRSPLLEWGEVVYGNSPSSLLAGGEGRDERIGMRGPAAVFGDPTPKGSRDRSHVRAGIELRPLPYARLEAAAVAKSLPGSRAYVGVAATESAFRREMSRAGILHVATHGFADDRHPEFSSLLLARGAGEDDGLLQAYELLDARCAADLVTLSACESGTGRESAGEGVLGLSRAFAVAGARQLIVSLWRVDDVATSELMTRFYEALRRGSTPAAALRSARLALWRGGPARGTGAASRGVAVQDVSVLHAHPSAWAAFVLQASRLR